MILPVVFALLAPSITCHPISSDWISGRDLSAAVPALAGLPPDIRVGFSPVPGLQRTLHAPELRRIAAANHLQADVSSDVCFAWTMAIPSRDAIVSSMTRSLEGRNPSIEWVDQSLNAAPQGKIEFPLSGLSAFSDGPVVWRGYVEYASARRFGIWARVRVLVDEPRVVAAEAIQPGQTIKPDQVRIENYKGSLTREAPLTKISDAVGMVARSEFRAGAPIAQSLLDQPREVEPGETVEVIIQSGAAHIESQGVAEQGGRRGDLITVRNLRSGRSFRARIEAMGRVVVVPGGPSGLVGDEKKS